MNRSTLLTALGALGAFGACATVELAPRTWDTSAEGQAAYPARVSATAATSGTQTAVSVALASGTPGATHPWHVHRGTCANDQGILGAADAYSPLRPGPDGRASSTATVGVPLSAAGSYFINVHASPQDLARIIACVPLRPR